VEVFRIANKRFSDLSGKGGIYGAGRWHVKGFPVVYTACSRSLSMLERFIHESNTQHPRDLVMLTIHIDDNVPSEKVQAHSLPDKWSDTNNENQKSTQNIGTMWLNEQRTPILIVPSAIVPQENNVIINPFLVANFKISVVDQVEYSYEQRYAELLLKNR